MDAGNDLRARTGRSDAMALLAVTAMRATRAEIGVPEDQSADRVAFIVDSLKHPAEVIVLRQLYGASFIAVAVFNNRDERIASTANRLATRKTVGGLWKGPDAEGGASCSRPLPGASASSDHFRRCRHRWVQRLAQRERHNPYHLGYRDQTGKKDMVGTGLACARNGALEKTRWMRCRMVARRLNSQSSGRVQS